MIRPDTIDSNDRATVPPVPYLLLVVALGLSAAIVGPALPTLAENTGISLAAAGALFLFRSAGVMAGSWAAGKIYDRAAGHGSMVLLAIALVVVLVVLPMVPGAVPLYALGLLAGAFEAGLHVGSNTFLLRRYRASSGPYLNALHFCFGVGAAIAPALIAIGFYLDLGIVFGFLGTALLTIIVTPMIRRMPNPATIVRDSDAPPDAPLRRGVLLMLVAFFALYVGVESAVGGWLYSYGLEMGLASKTGAAWLTSLFWGMLALGRLLGVLLTRRFSPRRLLPLYLLGIGVSLVVMIALPHSTVAFVVAVAGAGFSCASIFPTSITFAQELLPTGSRLLGGLYFGAGLGSLLFPWLVGLQFESIGPEVVPFAGLGLLLATAALYASLVRVKRVA